MFRKYLLLIRRLTSGAHPVTLHVIHFHDLETTFVEEHKSGTDIKKKKKNKNKKRARMTSKDLNQTAFHSWQSEPNGVKS